jgi:hypothetical protein
MLDSKTTPPDADVRVLQDGEIDAVSGASANLFSMLQDAFSTALKAIGEGLTQMARK